MREKIFFWTIIGVNFLTLLLQIKGLSISYNEAKYIFEDQTILTSIIQYSLRIFGQNDYALRIPMIILHIISVFLLHSILRYYIDRSSDRLWVLFIYILLPGVTSIALIIDNAGLVITSLFCFVYIYLRVGKSSLGLLPFFLWIDPSFSYLFFAVALYGLYRKDYFFISLGTFLLFLSLWMHGIHVGGVPESRFLDALGVYAAIFSPIVFIYLFYVLYRRMIAKEWDLIWTIAMSALIISLLLSFRQKVEIQTFAPFILLALPLAAQTFIHTYRIRLREFRGRYRILFYSAFALLIVNALAVFFNHYLYRFFQNPTHHFSYPMHVAKDLATVLHQNDISCVNAQNEKLQLRLRFYGITHCESNRLDNKPSTNSKKVTISYINTPIYFIYVTKVNK